MLNCNEIRNEISYYLQKNRNILHDSSLKLAAQITNTCYRNMLFDQLMNHKTGTFDIEIIVEFINNNIYNIKNFVFKHRRLDNGFFDDNEISFFPFFYPKEINYLFNIPHEEYTPRKDQLTKDCVHEFFQMSESIEYYNKFGDWDLFTNKIVDVLNHPSEIDCYSVNLDSLKTYIIHIVEYLFPEYKYSEHYSTKYNRFVKELNDEYLIALEYDFGLLENMRTTGFIEFSQYLNIVLINKVKFKKKDKPNHVFKQREDLLSLGRLGNPFIYIILPIEAYLTNFKLLKKAEYSYEWLSKLPFETVDLGNGMVEVKYNKIYAEQAKKYLMYFLYATAFTASGYLDYIEICVSELLNEHK